MRRMFVLGDNRIKWAVGVIGRALESYRHMCVIRDPIQQSFAYARLADAGLATQQSDLTVAALGPLPQVVQLMQFILPADKPRQLLRTDGSETALDHPFPQNPPGRHRLRKSFQFERSQLLAHEHVAQQACVCWRRRRRCSGPPRFASRAARFGVSPTTICSCAILTDGVTDNDQAGRNPNPHLRAVPRSGARAE